MGYGNGVNWSGGKDTTAASDVQSLSLDVDGSLVDTVPLNLSSTNKGFDAAKALAVGWKMRGNPGGIKARLWVDALAGGGTVVFDTPLGSSITQLLVTFKNGETLTIPDLEITDILYGSPADVVGFKVRNTRGGILVEPPPSVPSP